MTSTASAGPDTVADPSALPATGLTEGKRLTGGAGKCRSHIDEIDLLERMEVGHPSWARAGEECLGHIT